MRHYFKFTPAKILGLVAALLALGTAYNVFGPEQAKAVAVLVTAVAAMFSDPPAPTSPATPTDPKP